MRKLVLVTTILIASSSAFAQEEEAEIRAYTNAVQNTQKDLVNAAQREKMADSKESKAVMNQVKNLTGNPADEARLYEIAAQVLGDIKGKSDTELANAVSKAQNNPDGLYKSLSPETQKKIRELAGSIEARQKKKP